MKQFSIIERSCRTFSERRLKKYDLGFSEQLVLMYVSAHDEVNQEKIARNYMIDKGAIAKTSVKLEKKGFITRIQNPDNKREYLVSLTQDGQNIIKHMNEILIDWNEGLYEGISEEDIIVMKRTTEKMVANAAKLIDRETNQ
ncbi:MarR family transcriptional regulator [Acetobacterium paludosum]|uniref:MarR family transcriptional regulator n=1 Tax=Acetobacterium paludosum TaxID=52693 RepID=A0A923HUW6_9FIRM|nr:MarR family transcriptional regulator [Acetobacterium paludosum]MBC3889004.1 MarR family transcriptional regulator [Acetobacterium paludosum]